MSSTSKPGTTPLSPDEQQDLIPNLATQEELNEWESKNILSARQWALSERQIKQNDPLTEPYVRELHKRMLNETWKWAGVYRVTEKAIGVLVHEIRDNIKLLIDDTKYWVTNDSYDPDEIAVRFHHRLVCIHPFPNGNGRHARLMADVIVVRLGRGEFTWGQNDLVTACPARESYLQALRAADSGEIQPLLKFARS